MTRKRIAHSSSQKVFERIQYQLSITSTTKLRIHETEEPWMEEADSEGVMSFRGKQSWGHFIGDTNRRLFPIQTIVKQGVCSLLNLYPQTMQTDEITHLRHWSCHSF